MKTKYGKREGSQGSKKNMKKSIQATEHLMNIKSENFTPAAATKLNDWLAENPENLSEIEVMNMLWDYSEIFREHPLSQKVPKKGVFTGCVVCLSGWASKLWGRRPLIHSLGLAFASVLLLIGIWITQIPVATQQVYSTISGEQKILYLKDDLTVHLDTDTLISVDLTKKRRHIDLVKGRALFKVTSDVERSLKVTVGKYNIYDLGTEFNVKKDLKGKISVVVLKGRVEIVDKHQEPEPAISEKQKIPEEKPVRDHKMVASLVEKKPASVKKVILSGQKVVLSGQEIIIDEKEKVYALKTADIKTIDEWLNGRLYFDKAPLVHVVSEINRYLEKKIIIGDESLKELRVTINFKISDRKHFLTTITEILPVMFETLIDGQYILKRNNDA